MINQVIEEIETGNVRFDMMLASTLNTLLLRMEGNSVLKKARALLRANSDFALLFLIRARALYARPSAKGYLHPDDMALAAYIYLLGLTAHRDAHRFIDQVVKDRNLQFRASGLVADYIVRHAAVSTSDIIADSILEDATFDFHRTKYAKSKPLKTLGVA